MWCKLTSGLLHMVIMADICSTSTDIVVDLLTVLSEDSDLPAPQVQSLLTQDYVECSLMLQYDKR